MSICKRRKVCPLGADARPCCLEPTIGRKFGDLADDNWTCKRALDGAIVQKNFVLSDSRLFVDNVWNDDVVAVGVDHRCVHCVLTRNKSLKSWVPFLDATGEPSLYRNVLDTQFGSSHFGSSGSSFSNATDTSNLQFVVTHLPCTGFFFHLSTNGVIWILFNLFRL